MGKGKTWNPKIRERALASMRTGKSAVDVAREVCVPYKTVLTWRVRSGEFSDGRMTKTKTKTRPSPVNYLAGQLGIIAKMIREKLPELASFTLTTTDSGKATVEYAVRQTRVVTGSVKL